ncbi:phage tail tape measure protein [Neisseria brasiliensis]|uniref:phage tail tape measure protein n=1 Tax=Neisseria TaxID=482 RepID=UPI000C27506A|nr:MULTISPECIES: phage tail tape measure protein [Neisseria]PJO78237.1 phage tail tape measure protein [Neisseria sp. N177_16]QGL25049.1 phage tail tape measure protein [Neisseria brasiliensis]
MASDLGVSISVSATVGGALSGLASVSKAMKTLETTTGTLKARQHELASVLERNKDRLGVQAAKQLWQEYDKIDRSIKKLTASSAKLQQIQAAKAVNAQQWQGLKGQWQTAVGAAGTVALPVKLAIDFESSMADVRKVVDFDTPQQFKEMEQDILKMTRTIPMAATELAKISASGGQLGIARKDIPVFTETIAKMSVAFDMSAEQAGDSMAKLANIYKIPIAEIDKLGDAINHLSNNSPAKAADIVNVLGRVGGVAKQFGLTELQTTSLGNAFIALGRTPEVAGTAINGMLTQLMTADKQGKKFQAALASMGTDSKKLKKAIAENGEQALMDFLKQVEKLPKDQQMGVLVDLFGKEYADDVAALVGGLDTYKKSIEELKKTGKGGKPEFMGSMEKEFAARSATTANQIQLLKNSLVELGINVGSVILPAVNDFAGAITKIANKLADWANAHPVLTGYIIKTAMALAAMVAGGWLVRIAANRITAGFLTAKGALQSFKVTAQLVSMVMKGGILPADIPGRLGAFVRALSAARTAMMGFGLSSLVAMWPVVVVAGAVAVIAFLIYKYWQPLKAFFAGLWDGLIQGLATLKPMFDSLVSVIAPFGQVIMSVLGSIWSVIQPLVQPLLDWFGDFFNMSQVAEGGARNFGQSVGLWIGQTIAALVTFASTAWANIIAFFSAGIAALLNLILTFSPVTAFMTAFQAVWTWLSGLGATFMSYGSMMIDGLVNGIKAGIGRAVAAVQGVVSAVKSAFTSDRKGMGIHSPSRVFAGYGGYMTEGLAVGIKRTAGRPLQAVGAWAGRLKDGFSRRVGGMRADLAARISGSSADFAAARAAQSQAGGITVNFNPTIHAPGGDPGQIQTALQMGLREFEMLFQRMMADRERRAY